MTSSADRDLVDRFREAVIQRFGLHFDESKRGFLAAVLSKQIGRWDNADASAYIHRLLAKQLTKMETAALAEQLTVGETYFFRHSDQFRAFTDLALREHSSHPTTPRRLNILSAGCASGEEAYSLAILLCQHTDFARWDIRIVGIDLNPTALARARRARYTSWSLRGVSDATRDSYFRADDKWYRLDNAVRDMVAFEERNLLDENPEFWRADAFDVIFCRNVLMYFAPEAMRNVVDRFTRALCPGGYLFLGPAETLRGLSHDYHLRHAYDAFFYQRRPDGASHQPQAPLLPLPLFTALDGSWVTAIGKATERIARLSRDTRNSGSSNRMPANSPPPPREPASTGLLAARELIRQERYTDALLALDTLTDMERRDPDAQLLHAVSLTNSGKVNEAEQVCREVLAGDELNAEARYLLALCLEHGGNYESAIEEDQTAIYLDPQFAMPHLHLGLLNKRLGNRENARRAFQQALSLLPREDASRVLLFGGGFSRETLLRLCEAELRAGGGDA